MVDNLKRMNIGVKLYKFDNLLIKELYIEMNNLNNLCLTFWQK